MYFRKFRRQSAYTLYLTVPELTSSFLPVRVDPWKCPGPWLNT